MEAKTVGILIFPEVELLDFAGPFEVFSAVRAFSGSEDRAMDVFAVAESNEPIRCRNGLVVYPEYTLENCPKIDVLVVPGGRGTRTAMDREDLIEWIQRVSETAEFTTSVCTGSFLLAQAGLLEGKQTTTHWGSIDFLRDKFPNVEVLENIRWTETGNIISSAGVSAGIDMALYLVQKIYDKETADLTARGIEYDYWE